MQPGHMVFTLPPIIAHTTTGLMKIVFNFDQKKLPTLTMIIGSERSRGNSKSHYEVEDAEEPIYHIR